MQHPEKTIFKNNRLYAHLNSAAAILQAYDGSIPFSHFIRNHFSQHKKFGSKDRKQIASLCYGYFRLGRSFQQLTIEQRILKGLELCNPGLKEEWQAVLDQYELPVQQPDNIFTWKNELSSDMDAGVFEQSHLVQPDLFLRIRRGYERDVVEKLNAYKVPCHFTEGAVCLPNGFKTENYFHINEEVVVQDLSSQGVGKLLDANKSQILNHPSQISVWDCCAASGGKSILAKDVLENINLTVSDIRPSIMANLKKRFREAGLNTYRSFIADAAAAAPGKKFDLVIADVPCSGSGTWARAPEQLLFFDEKKIAVYAKLQSSIVTNISKHIKPGGYLLYITCSVFKKENEAQVQLLQSNGLQVIQQKIFKGYENRADTMFAALLRK